MIVEIQGTEGGEEANLWAGDLFRMYQRFAERQRLEDSRCCRASRPSTAATATSRSSSRATTRGAASSTKAVRTGCSGCPRPRARAAIHTSAATVAVLPEAEEVDVDIDPNDLEIDVFRCDRARAGSR